MLRAVPATTFIATLERREYYPVRAEAYRWLVEGLRLLVEGDAP